MTIKAYRGMLANGGQDKINLRSNKGDIGYKIHKFELMTNQPGDAGADSEHVVMIWSVERTSTELGNTTTTDPDFTNNELLGAGYQLQDVAGSGHGYWISTIFDKEMFNQNIYITQRDTGGNAVACNYYLELEQVKLNENESTMATLQSLRQIAER